MPRVRRSSGWASVWIRRRSCTSLLYKIRKGRFHDRNRPLTCVELRGFEPLTPSMRTRRATGLRYSPNNAVRLANIRHSSRTRTGVIGRPSVADRAQVGVLVVDLLARPCGEFDDLGRTLRLKSLSSLSGFAFLGGAAQAGGACGGRGAGLHAAGVVHA